MSRWWDPRANGAVGGQQAVLCARAGQAAAPTPHHSRPDDVKGSTAKAVRYMQDNIDTDVGNFNRSSSKFLM